MALDSSAASQLQFIGQQLAAAIVSAYGINGSDTYLAFLPGGVPVPDDLVESGLVNPTQVQTWVSMNFDFPFVVSSESAAAWARDESFGTATEIYSIAVNQAAPAANLDDASIARIAAEIVGARSSFGPSGSQTFACTPDDWPLPAAPYWTSFDSSTSSSSSSSVSVSSSSAGAVRIPLVDRNFWMVRSFAAPPSNAPSSSSSSVTATPIVSRSAMVLERPIDVVPATAAPVRALPLAETAAPAQTATPILRWRTSIDAGLLPMQLNARDVFAGSTSVDQVTTASSSQIVVQLEHQLVSLGRYSGGQPWWNEIFLDDPDWYVPGMARGGLLPAAVDADLTSGNALPTAMILVRNLKVSGQWSQSASAALSSQGGTIGPLSLFGATATTESDGVTVTYEHDGMQVVALVCSALPVLPPIDASAATAPSSSSSSSSSIPSSSSSSSSSSSITSSLISSSSASTTG